MTNKYRMNKQAFIDAMIMIPGVKHYPETWNGNERYVFENTKSGDYVGSVEGYINAEILNEKYPFVSYEVGSYGYKAARILVDDLPGRSVYYADLLDDLHYISQGNCLDDDRLIEYEQELLDENWKEYGHYDFMRTLKEDDSCSEELYESLNKDIDLAYSVYMTLLDDYPYTENLSYVFPDVNLKPVEFYGAYLGYCKLTNDDKLYIVDSVYDGDGEFYGMVRVSLANSADVKAIRLQRNLMSDLKNIYQGKLDAVLSAL